LSHTKDETGYIYLNIYKHTPEETWLNFVSAVDSQVLKNLLRTDLKNLEYIDLRFGNKIFYKFFKEQGRG